MRHARKDYDRLQDPALKDPKLLGAGCAPIGEDEPVFLVRAKDRLAPHNLFDYAQRAEDSGCAKELVESVRTHARAMLAWQETHGCKEPDLPVVAERRKK